MSHKDNPAHGFENKRWTEGSQKIEFRHRAGLELIPKDTKKLLDVGCGEGTYISLVHEKHPNIIFTGADISEVALRRISERDINIETVLVDATNKLPFNDEVFDVVSALDVLEHTLQPELMLSEIKRVSKKYIIIGVPNFSSFPARLQMLRGDVPENNKKNKGHMYWFNRQTLRSLIAENDLKIVKEITNHQLQRIKIIGYIINLFKKVFPSLFSLTFVILVEKK